ncbi:MAG: CoA-binding protein [Bacteroidales bacterium]|nr:CoA-binding protein [Bacteroidales bacterium]MDY0216685.1 CoA-binding protein [Bacteroidales bacterium]
MIQKKKIDLFFETPKIAVVGASRDIRKYGNIIYRRLKAKGYHAIPVNPFADEIDGDKCISSISDLNPQDTALVLVTHQKDTDRITEEAIRLGFTQIWVQTDCDTENTPVFAQDQALNIIHNYCILVIMKQKKESAKPIVL